LIFTKHFLPGVKGGGPILSVTRISETIGAHCLLSIVTSDRDVGDRQQYSLQPVGRWIQKEYARVYYAPRVWELWHLYKLMTKEAYDVIYLNSFFSPIYSIMALIMRRLGMTKERLFVIAPRGEFSSGALDIKPLKKKLFLWFAQKFLLQGIVWHATSKLEFEDIIRQGVNALHVRMVPQIPRKVLLEEVIVKTHKDRGAVSLVFLSRITPKKNLDFILHVLQRINGNVVFDIYGPIEDMSYWSSCNLTIGRLPTNVTVRYLGIVPTERVMRTLQHYHFFVLPTLGENYGHVIFEALAAGCPVIISEDTPWRDLRHRSIGWDLPLIEDVFVRAIQDAIDMGNDEYAKWSQYAIEHIREVGAQDHLAAYLSLFEATRSDASPGNSSTTQHRLF